MHTTIPRILAACIGSSTLTGRVTQLLQSIHHTLPMPNPRTYTKHLHASTTSIRTMLKLDAALLGCERGYVTELFDTSLGVWYMLIN